MLSIAVPTTPSYNLNLSNLNYQECAFTKNTSKLTHPNNELLLEPIADQ